MADKLTVKQYLEAIETVKRFEAQVKEELTIDDFLNWYEVNIQTGRSPSFMFRALSILKQKKDRIFSITGKDLKPFAGFAKSYGRGQFEITREYFFDKYLEGIKASE